MCMQVLEDVLLAVVPLYMALRPSSQWLPRFTADAAALTATAYVLTQPITLPGLVEYEVGAGEGAGGESWKAGACCI